MKIFPDGNYIFMMRYCIKNICLALGMKNIILYLDELGSLKL